MLTPADHADINRNVELLEAYVRHLRGATAQPCSDDYPLRGVSPELLDAASRLAVAHIAGKDNADIMANLACNLSDPTR